RNGIPLRYHGLLINLNRTLSGKTIPMKHYKSLHILHSKHRSFTNRIAGIGRCLFLLVLVWGQPLFSQGPPARLEEGSVTLRGGTIHIGDGTVIHEGHLSFQDGNITYIGDEMQQAARVIDVTGNHLY